MISVSVYVDVMESVEVEVIVAVTELQESLDQHFDLTVGDGLWDKSKKNKGKEQARKRSPTGRGIFE